MIARTLIRPIAFAGAIAALSFSLGGCISLLPKAKPAQLYRFGSPAADATGTSADAHQRGVVLGQIGFPREANTDGILTVNGAQTAYIADVRWVAPAVVLFQQAIPTAFDAPGSRTRVLTRGEVGAAAGVLQLDVAKFEADYAGGQATVSVMIRGRLSRSDGTMIGERNFDVEKLAGANRVSAIVPAFDAATREALGQVVAWTDQSLDANPPPPPPTVSRSSTSSTTTTITHRR